jgi:hypothetical protein
MLRLVLLEDYLQKMGTQSLIGIWTLSGMPKELTLIFPTCLSRDPIFHITIPSYVLPCLLDDVLILQSKNVKIHIIRENVGAKQTQ